LSLVAILEHTCLNCNGQIIDTPSQQRKFCSTKCYAEYRKKHGLSASHREALSSSIENWWQLVKKQNPEYLVWRRERIKQALNKIPEEKHLERYEKIAEALHGRQPVNTGVRTGSFIKCLQCEKEFYRQPRSSKRFCSRQCWRTYNENHWFELHQTIKKHYSKNDLFALVGKCEKCEFSDERILMVHHKDGKKKNNTTENLVLLCPNCHMLIHLNENGKVDFRAWKRML